MFDSTRNNRLFAFAFEMFRVSIHISVSTYAACLMSREFDILIIILDLYKVLLCHGLLIILFI